jgi:hypothetical protein
MLNKLIAVAMTAVSAAAATGQLPHLIQTVRIAQLQLLKESQSSKWGKPFLLPVEHSSGNRNSRQK